MFPIRVFVPFAFVSLARTRVLHGCDVHLVTAPVLARRVERHRGEPFSRLGRIVERVRAREQPQRPGRVTRGFSIDLAVAVQQREQVSLEPAAVRRSVSAGIRTDGVRGTPEHRARVAFAHVPQRCGGDSSKPRRFRAEVRPKSPYEPIGRRRLRREQRQLL